MLGFIKKMFGKDKPKKEPPRKEDLIGVITHYYGKSGAAVLKVKNGPLAIGDTIRIYGKNIDFEQSVSSMEIDRKPIPKAEKGQEIGLGIKKKVHPKDGIYRVSEKAHAA